MSRQLISRNADLKRLQDEGYDVQVRGTHLVVGHVPYLDANRALQHGIFVTELALSGDVTVPPRDHTIFFAGSHPCDRYGAPLDVVADTDLTRVRAPVTGASFGIGLEPPAPSRR